MAALQWKDISEIVAGQIIMGSLSESSVNPGWLIEPYASFVKKAQSAKKKLQPEKVIELLGIPAYQAALEAAKVTHDMPEAWSAILQQASRNHELGIAFKKAGERLLAGESQDLTKLREALDGASSTEAFEIKRLSDIEIPPDYNPFIPSGYEPIDTWVGGWPGSGLTIIAAPPGTGKTFLALRAMESFAKLGKNSMFFSIEQTNIQIAFRCRVAMKMSKAVQRNIQVYDAPISVDDVVQIVMGLEGVDMVVIDFAELLVEGDDQISSEQIMTYIYRKLAKLAKLKGIVILLLAQFNRANYTQMSLSGIRYSGAAEQMAALILFLYNPSQMYAGLGVQTNGHIALDPGSGAILVAKSRHGYKMGGPIAIEVLWTDGGWAKESLRYHVLGG